MVKLEGFNDWLIKQTISNNILMPNSNENFVSSVSWVLILGSPKEFETRVQKQRENTLKLLRMFDDDSDLHNSTYKGIQRYFCKDNYEFQKYYSLLEDSIEYLHSAGWRYRPKEKIENRFQYDSSGNRQRSLFNELVENSYSTLHEKYSENCQLMGMKLQKNPLQIRKEISDFLKNFNFPERLIDVSQDGPISRAIENSTKYRLT